VTEPHDAQVKVLRVITGAQPYAAFQAAINSLLSEQK
jgi:hypothetical protein